MPGKSVVLVGLTAAFGRSRAASSRGHAWRQMRSAVEDFFTWLRALAAIALMMLRPAAARETE